MAKNADEPPLTLVSPAVDRRSHHRASSDNMGSPCGIRCSTAYRIDDVGGIELLAQACAASDRVEALAERITTDGEVVQTRAGPKAHPALRDELAGRAFIVRTLERLGLNVEAIKPIGRPSKGWGGNRAD